MVIDRIHGYCSLIPPFVPMRRVEKRIIITVSRIYCVSMDNVKYVNSVMFHPE
jgi:hypothetical protein